jgi:hypothetical protein
MGTPIAIAYQLEHKNLIHRTPQEKDMVRTVFFFLVDVVSDDGVVA